MSTEAGQFHAQATAELDSAFRQLGLAVAQAMIVEFASSWLGGGALGTVSGSVLGAATKSADGFLVLAFFGMIIGALAGALKQVEQARYFATLTASSSQVIRQEASPVIGMEPVF